MAKTTYAEFCGMAPLLGVMMSVLLMKVGGDVTKKMRKGYRACQRMSGSFVMTWPVGLDGSSKEYQWGSSGKFLSLLLRSPLLCVHTTLRFVAKIPKYTARSKTWAWPKKGPKSKKSSGKWSSRHWRYWKAWKWAYGKKAQGNATSKEDHKKYSEFKSGQPSKFSLGHLWKIDVKWTLQKGHFHFIKKIMSKSTQIIKHGMKRWYRRPVRLGNKQPYGRILTNSSTWWGHTKGQLGSTNQIKQHKAKISKVDGLSGTGSDVNKYNTVLKQYNRRMALYQKMPLKTMSRWWGEFNQLELPVWLRTPAFNLYIWMFGCKLHEAAVEDLTRYRNLSEFFRRQLKHGLRPVDIDSDLVSPADGRVLYKGHVTDGALEQVKGVFYSLQGFLGPLPELYTNENSGCDLEKHNETNKVPNIGDSDTAGESDLHIIDAETLRILNDVNKRVTLSDNDLDKTVTLVDTDLDKMMNLVDQDLKKMMNLVDDDLDKTMTLVGTAIDKTKSLVDDDLDNTLTLVDDELDKAMTLVDNDLNKTMTLVSNDLHETVTLVDDDCDRMTTLVDIEYAASLLTTPSHVLHHCVVYLAPGDYHRFHSPADWTVQYRRHFPGELFSVKPGIARWLQGLFSFNERAVYFGTWKYGFFSMTAVGATNVGSINVFFDKDLKTNTNEFFPPGTMFDKDLRTGSNIPDLQCGVKVSKGQLMGDFNLGSTIVLVFEAPSGFSFSINEGQKVIYGESLGRN